MASTASSTLSEQMRQVNALTAGRGGVAPGRRGRAAGRRHRLNGKKKDGSNSVQGEEVVSEGSSSDESLKDLSLSPEHPQEEPQSHPMLSFSLSDVSTVKSSLMATVGTIKPKQGALDVPGTIRADSISSVSSLQVMQREVDAEERQKNTTVSSLSGRFPVHAPPLPPMGHPDQPSTIMSASTPALSATGLTNNTASEVTIKVPPPVVSENGGSTPKLLRDSSVVTDATAKMPPRQATADTWSGGNPGGGVSPERSCVTDLTAKMPPASELAANGAVNTLSTAQTPSTSELSKKGSVVTDLTAKMPPMRGDSSDTRLALSDLTFGSTSSSTPQDNVKVTASEGGVRSAAPVSDSGSSSSTPTRNLSTAKIASILLDTRHSSANALSYQNIIGGTILNQYQLLRATGLSPAGQPSTPPHRAYSGEVVSKAYFARDLSKQAAKTVSKGGVSTRLMSPSARAQAPAGAGLTVRFLRSNEASGAYLEEKRSEIALLKRLRHRNIVTTLEVLVGDAEDGIPDVYAVAALCTSEASVGHVDQARGELLTPVLPDKLLAHYLFGAASGLAYLHKMGLSHGDVRPENVLIIPDTLQAVAKLTNVGLMSTLRPPGLQVGSPSAAPEVCCLGGF